jgi:hypothetical protein
MTGWLWVAMGVLIPLAYLMLGGVLAVRALPRAWRRARQIWHFDGSTRDSVKAQTLVMVFAWPLLLLVRAISDTVDQVIDEADPKVLAGKLRDREARIRELERELGIGS